MANKTYSEKLKDPRWQSKRIEILERDGYKCKECKSLDDLQVHHKRYIPGRDPWQYDGFDLVTLCNECHERQHGIALDYDHLYTTGKLPVVLIDEQIDVLISLLKDGLKADLEEALIKKIIYLQTRRKVLING